MYYGEIKDCDIANGPGVRVSLFVSGCTHKCLGCFNKETWNPTYGKPYTIETIEYLKNLLSKDYIDGLSLLGGDPLDYNNPKELLELVKYVKLDLKKSIWLYTGDTIENILNIKRRMLTKEDIKLKYNKIKLLENIDVLVDGPFIEHLKDITLKFRGSSNQRIIDMKKVFNEYQKLKHTNMNYLSYIINTKCILEV